MVSRNQLFFVLAPLLAAQALVCGCRRDNGGSGLEGQNVLLITLDTTRSDRIGAYGHKPARTPTLDALAARGTLFENAFAQAPLTLPSHISMMTGRYPREHGVRDNARGALSETFPVLAAAFKEHGYRTAGFVASFVLDSRFGLARGFDAYEDDMLQTSFETQPLEWQIPGNLVTDRAMKWLEANKKGPFFCWVHYYDAHSPHEIPKGFSAPGADVYDAELAFIDTQVKRITDWLAAGGMTENTLIVVVGDHGESLGEHHEEGHAHFVYNSNLQVPFFFAHPTGVPANRRVGAVVEVLDVFPTVLDLMGWKKPDGLLCRSLVPAFTGDDFEPVAAYGESHYVSNNFGWAQQRCLTTDRWKYISSTKPELFDRRTDAAEMHNVIDANADVAAEMVRALKARYQAMKPGTAGAVKLSAEARRGLEGLGYLGGGSEAPEEFLGENLPDPKDMVSVFQRHQAAVQLMHRHPGIEGDKLALPLIESIVRDSPGSTLFHASLATAYFRLGRYDEAVAEAEVTLKLDRAYSPAHALIGDVELKLGRPDEAIRRFQIALEIDDQSPEMHSRLADALVAAGRIDEAMEKLRTAIRLFPDFALAHGKLAELLDSRGKTKEAAEHFDLALKLKADEPDVHFRIGLVHVRAKRFPAAIEQFRRTIKLKPGHAEARLNLGAALGDMGEYDEAREVLRHAAAETTSPAEANYQLAMLAARQGNYTEAIPLLEQAIQVKPRLVIAVEWLSGYYLSQNQTEPARRVLTVAVDAGATDPKLVNTLAKILSTSNDAALRDGAKAVTLAKRNLEAVDPNSPALLQTLAAAYAEQGDYESARRTVAEAKAAADKRGQTELAQQIAAQISLYSAGQPYRDPRF